LEETELAHAKTVWAFVGMRRYKNELQKYLRYKRHVSYVESRVVQLRSNICKQAVLYGNVSNITRELYLKYNDYLKLLRPD